MKELVTGSKMAQFCFCDGAKLYSPFLTSNFWVQIAKALQFIHERGIAHLDVKLDNIYVKNGIYKLGDFGCATLLDKSLPIEEGDARYMPQEIFNDKYDHLDKVDIFSLGAAMYELIRGSPLPESGPHFVNLREGKFPLLPGHSLQFQNLLKVCELLNHMIIFSRYNCRIEVLKTLFKWLGTLLQL